MSEIFAPEGFDFSIDENIVPITGILPDTSASGSPDTNGVDPAVAIPDTSAVTTPESVAVDPAAVGHDITLTAGAPSVVLTILVPSDVGTAPPDATNSAPTTVGDGNVGTDTPPPAPENVDTSISDGIDMSMHNTWLDDGWII